MDRKTYPSYSDPEEFTVFSSDRAEEPTWPIPTPQPIPATLAAAFRSSSWIWQDPQALMGVPSGNWAFRKTLPASTVPAKEAIVLLTKLDLGMENGEAVQIDLDPNSNVFAVQARNSRFGADPNGNSSAGLLASIQISYADGTTTTISSDDTWRVTQPVPDGFQSPSFDDTQWQFAVTLVNYGLGRGGTLQSPPQVSHFPAH
ncbi:hypothetical protein BD779DRAFT_1469104 [Infundibulicybe gibba]|nr:hypothetical protein BD779DRAFT_1469104 [Infundibulicybe gibba]